MLLTKTKVYLDSNAGAPLSAAALDKLRDFSLIPTNPSSIHSYGQEGKKLYSEAKEKIVASLGSRIEPEQFLFTSSGTEANQWIIRSVLEPRLLEGKPTHWITTPIEHDSVRQMVDYFQSRGVEISFLPVNSNGNVEVRELPKYIQPHTALISCIWVNNETGVIINGGELARLASDFRIPVHLDGAQAWGKIRMDLSELEVQWVSFSGHKIGGLPGIGGIWSDRRFLSQLKPLIFGKQEKGRRGGTENITGAIALGEAASQINLESYIKKTNFLKDRLEQKLRERIPGSFINGEDGIRVTNTTNITFDGIEGDGLVMALDLEGYCVSAGAACSSGAMEPSHVLMAMGRSKELAMSAIRISLHEGLTVPMIDGFIDTLEKVVFRIRMKKGYYKNV